MKESRIIVGAVLLICVIAAGAYVSGRHVSASSSYSCVAGINELCPNEVFVNEYTRLKALNADLAREQQSPGMRALQDKQDLANGLARRLISEFPTGYTWDEKKSRFVQAPMGLPPLTSAPVRK